MVDQGSMDGRHPGLVKQNSGRMYKDCQREKSVDNVDISNGCRPSAMKSTRDEVKGSMGRDSMELLWQQHRSNLNHTCLQCCYQGRKVPGQGLEV